MSLKYAPAAGRLALALTAPSTLAVLAACAAKPPRLASTQQATDTCKMFAGDQDVATLMF